MDWTPHTVFHCIANDALAWVTIIGACGIVFWYSVITLTTWLPAVRTASRSAGNAIWWMAVIFIVCSIAGYGTLALAAWYPKMAYILRAVFLVFQNIAAPWFLLSNRGKQFKLIGRNELVGSKLMAQYSDKSSDRELASMARSLVRDSLSLVALSRKEPSSASLAINEATVLADAMLETARQAAEVILETARINADKLLVAAAAAAAAAARDNH